MAQSTIINITLGARDWETIIGIMDNSSIPAFRKLKNDLCNHYAANGNPQGTAQITITTKEFLLVEIFRALFGNTISNLMNDTGASAFFRIISAIRAANNPADNYIQTELAKEDAARQITITSIRKNGRAILMMESFDGN